MININMKLVSDFEPPESVEILIKTSGGLYAVVKYEKYFNENINNTRGGFYLQSVAGVEVDAVWWSELSKKSAVDNYTVDLFSDYVESIMINDFSTHPREISIFNECTAQFKAKHETN